MRRYLILVIFCSGFFSTAFADTKTILVDKQEITVPTFEGFEFTSDRNSAEFKKLDADYVTTGQTITHGYYYEPTPGKLSKVISILSYQSSPEFITKKDWTRAKNDIYEDSQKPIIKEESGAKAEQIMRESITTPDLYNTYIAETKIYIKKNDKYDYVLSNLDSKTYLYLNGKVIVLMITIDGINAFNDDTIKWAKTISQTTAERLIELNPPTQATLQAEKKEEAADERHRWKVILLVIIGAASLLWRYRDKIMNKIKP